MEEKPAAPKDDMNFDLLGPSGPSPGMEKARTNAAFEKRVRIRRGMLKWHVALGFVTLIALSATNIIGTLNYVDKFGGGNDDGRYYDAHTGLAVATTAVFMTTGALALFAPNPYPKPVKFDSALVHKLSMALATAGFLAQVIMGPISHYSEGKLVQKDLALSHLVIGWATYGFMAAGTLAYVF